MKAMMLDRFGGPDVLHLGDLPMPQAGPGQVVVQVAFAGVNPADWKIREGWLAQFFTPQFPFVPGFDASGIVTALGDGVTGLSIGDRVVTPGNQGKGERGSYAEYLCADAERVIPLPAAVSLRDAATLPTAGMTAWEAVFDVGHVAPGHRVLVNGGAGGTGSFAIQLAVRAGARVAATCSAANADYVRSLGAELTIDYRTGRVVDAVRQWAPEGVDLIVDTVGQGSLLDGIEVVKPGGVIAPIATMIADEPMPDAETAERRGVRLVPTMSTFANQPRQLRGLVGGLADGTLRAPERREMPLAEAAEAHRMVAAGHVRGKILLAVAPDLDR